MQIVVSIVALALGTMLLVGDFGDDRQKIGAGLVGTVIGYWLR